MGYSFERYGFATIDALAKSIIADMTAAGFTKLYPEAPTESTKAFTLVAGPTVDPLAATQPWAVKLMWDKGADDVTPDALNGGILDIIVATPRQFSATGHAKYERYYGANTGWEARDYGVHKDVVGLVGTALYRKTPNQSSSSEVNVGYSDRTFLDRTRLLAADGSAYPMSYRLTVSTRGFALFVWEEGHEREANLFSWVVVQRPVDNKTGQVYTSGKAPVHCVYGLMKNYAENQSWLNNGVYNIRRFIVRESDINVPYPLGNVTRNQRSELPNENSVMMGVVATHDTRDYNGILNASQQVSISEANKYIISFPNGLNTARYAYPHELDMIAYTSADVVSQGTIVPVTVYGEAQPRKYAAMSANGPNNTGMRILMLVEGGGVSPGAPSGGP